MKPAAPALPAVRVPCKFPHREAPERRPERACGRCHGEGTIDLATCPPEWWWRLIEEHDPEGADRLLAAAGVVAWAHFPDGDHIPVTRKGGALGYLYYDESEDRDVWMQIPPDDFKFGLRLERRHAGPGVASTLRPAAAAPRKAV